MSKVSIGTLCTYNHEVNDWQIYKDRLEQWFLANDVDADEKGQIKRRAILVSSLSENTYRLVRDLALPSNITSLSYGHLVKLLDGHFKPTKCGFAERYLFHSSAQLDNETLTEWAARVRSLAAGCDFPATMLTEVLRDRFVLGMLSGPERDKLFTMDIADLSLSEAIQTAEAIRCARLGAAQTTARAPVSSSMHKMAASASPLPARATEHGTTAAASSRSRDSSLRCTACGFQGHEVSTCKFVKYKCNMCGVKGHLRRVCPKKCVKHNFIECSTNNGDVSSDDGESNIIAHIKTVNGEPMHESVLLDGVHIDFELDCGSPITIIPQKLYKDYFSSRLLYRSNLILSAYNGSNIKVLGFIRLTVTYSSKSHDLDVYVAQSEGVPLLGRDFFSKFNLQISMINSCSSMDEYVQLYPQLFSDELGCYKNSQVSLTLKSDAKPIFYKARPVPFALRSAVENEITRLIKVGILVPVNFSDYASPVVPVLKHDGSIRLCADYSVTLNKQLVIDKYPLPRIEELFAKLHGGQKFSKLDLSQAYAQLELQESSQMLTCINTHKGLYKFTRLVYGLSSAAAVFQKTIETILSGLDGVLIFQDDILISESTDTLHKSRLHEVFTRLQSAGLVLQKEKCFLFQDSVSYLGFTIDKHGLHKSPDKVKSIREAKIPSNVSELKSFLGMVNYYRNFVKNASSILNPLHSLLQKNVPWHWNTEHDNAVAAIKQALSSHETLAHFNPDSKIILTVDASPTGLGAILSQIENGIEKPISYASRSLSKAEKSYSQIQKEATAIIFGVRKFHQYLYGRSDPFILRTDHKPLLSIFNPNKGVPEVTANRLQRYAIYLNSYNFVIEYVCSAQNAADFLSRSTVEQSSEVDDAYLDKATYVNFVFGSSASQCLTIDNIVKATAADQLLTQVCNYVLNGWPSKIRDDNLKSYHSCRNELSVEKSCLLRGHKLVIPSSCRQQVLRELHSGHLGSYKMKSEARNRFWWPRMSTDIDIYVCECEVCAKARPSPPRAPLAPWRFPPQPWYRAHMDCLGPINNRTYLIIVDAYSKWVECFDVSSGYSTRVIIDKLCEVMSRFGLIHTICSDNGSSFVSDEFKLFCSRNNIVHITSPTYNPISNGQAESSVKIVKKAIKNIITSGICQRDLNTKLNEFLFCYRNSTHSTTNKSPAEILFGHKLRNRLDLINIIEPSPCDATLDAFVKDKQCLQSRYYGGKREVTFSVNESVLVKVFKMQKQCWVPGTVLKQLGNTLYLIKVCESGAVIKKHTNQLLKLKGEKWYDDRGHTSCSDDDMPARDSAPTAALPPVVMSDARVAPPIALAQVPAAPTPAAATSTEPTAPAPPDVPSAPATVTSVPDPVATVEPAPESTTTARQKRARPIVDYKRFL